MESGHSRKQYPFLQQGPFNPEHEYVSHHPYRSYLKQDSFEHKRTPTTKNSLDNRHNSSKHIHKKRENTHDVSQNFTQIVRERRIRSHSKNRTQKSDIEGNDQYQNFGKITMHCLRKRRQIFEKDAQSLQSEYTYLLRKIEKLQKQKSQQQFKNRRKQLIQFKRKRELSSLHNVKASNDSLILRRKENLKQQILSHRANKTHSVVANREQKSRMGEEQRLLQGKIHQELIYMHESRLQQNKMKYQREKTSKLRRQRRMRSEIQSKRVAVLDDFKHKWLDQYERQEAAKQEYRVKKSQFQRKIREAIEIYKEIQAQ